MTKSVDIPRPIWHPGQRGKRRGHIHFLNGLRKTHLHGLFERYAPVSATVNDWIVR